jgi:hypothetical protein
MGHCPALKFVLLFLFLCDALLVSVPFVLPCEAFRMYFVICPLLISVSGICLLENESFV